MWHSEIYRNDHGPLFATVLRRSYAADESGHFARPWQLAWRADHSVSGMIEPDVGILLLELILSEGLLSWLYFLSVLSGSVLDPHARFLSDPDVVGCEKVAVTLVPQAFLNDVVVEMPPLHAGSFLQLSDLPSLFFSAP